VDVAVVVELERSATDFERVAVGERLGYRRALRIFAPEFQIAGIALHAGVRTLALAAAALSLTLLAHRLRIGDGVAFLLFRNRQPAQLRSPEKARKQHRPRWTPR